ncbi:MAG TPA: acetate--CoA ligase family protein [Candidatus Dormibacteraeota bacterium]|nr:acetate--CoA ligase family protein [Candidatus Dormibacteraeota bacterium]
MSRQAQVAAILNASSIALVGATENSAWSAALLANLTGHGFEGRIHLVNPRHREQFGLPCHPSVSAIGEPVDCAYVMTAADAVPSVIEDLAGAGVAGAVLLTPGYREVGAAGAERERALVERCAAAGMALEGPNCLGFINYGRRLVAYALPVTAPLRRGRVGLVTQSGAMLLHLHRLAQGRAIGLSHIVSSGNEAMLEAADYIEFLLDDPGTAVVGAFLEGIGDAGRFLAAADRALARGKPLIILKSGSSAAAARSALAHTGALAVEDRVIEAVFRQKGVVRVGSLEELVETSALLAAPRLPEGRRFAMLTASGGACGVLADLAQRTRLEVPDFGPGTKAALKAVLPEFGTAQNPLDTTGLIVNDMSLLPRSLAAVGGDGAFDAVLVVWDPPRDAGLNPERTEARLRALAEAARSSPIPTFLTSYVASELTPFGQDAVARHGVHFSNGMGLAVRALDGAVGYTENRRRLLAKGARVPAVKSSELAGSGPLSELASLRLLERSGIPVPPERLARSALDAARLAREAGFPAVLKVNSPDIQHKTEAGAVRLHCLTPEEAASAYRDILSAVQQNVPGARVDGVLVVHQVFPVAELIAGIATDPQFGPMLLVGLGGIFVEVLDDFALRMPPIDFDDAVDMLSELRGKAVLEGARGAPRGDIHAAAVTLVRLGRLAFEHPERIEAVDVNPLFVLPDGEGVLAGDALVVLR